MFQASDIIFYRIISPWTWSDLGFRLNSRWRPFQEAIKTLHDTTDKVIGDRKKFYYAQKKEASGTSEAEEEEPKKKRLAFLDLLIEASDEGRVLSDADIREEV